jgi:hypothetical protein
LIDHKQLKDCNIAASSKDVIVKKADITSHNSKDNYLTVDLFEEEFIMKPKHVGSRKIHLNFLLNEGKKRKGMKSLTLWDTNEEINEKYQKQQSTIDLKKSITSSIVDDDGYIYDRDQNQQKMVAGELQIEWELINLISQDMLDKETTPSEDFRAVDGVMEICVKNIMGFNQNVDPYSV